METMNMIPMSQPITLRRDDLAVPTCGRFPASTWAGGIAANAAAARVRLVKGTDVKGHVGMFATTGDVAYVPGTRAWSPPPC